MVQYVFTPWHDRVELLRVRQQLFPEGGTTYQSQEALRQQRPSEKHAGIDRVSLWMHRGNCPHMIESTALLVSCMLADTETRPGPQWPARLGYASAFTRFVTGLLDTHQSKQRKQNMYTVAKILGLPASFVELRHQATHEALPSLRNLRAAARRALAWIWGFYWVHLGDDEATAAAVEAVTTVTTSALTSARDKGGFSLPAAVMELLQVDAHDEEAKTDAIARMGAFDEVEVLAALDEAGEQDPTLLLKASRATRELLRLRPWVDHATSEQPRRVAQIEMDVDVDEADTAHQAEVDLRTETPIQEVEQARRGSKRGWYRWEGPWEPKPIGVV